MIPVLDSAQMRDADRVTITDLGMPGLALMEMAAAGVTEALLERFGEARHVVVACGPGNNGGDGLAVARQLKSRGMGAVEAWVLVGEEALSGDAAVQLRLARAFGVLVHEAAGDLGAFGAALEGAEVVVDALFGTGLDRPLSGRLAGAVARINACQAPVVAVDVPSGLSGSSAEVEGESVEAALTVTFAAPKVAHVLPPACWRCGEVAVAEIGIPHWVVQRAANLFLVEEEDVAAWLPQRPVDAHKGHFGHLCVAAGRFGRAGAAALAARAAVTAGAGLVTVCLPAAAVNAVQALVPEAMVNALEGSGEGAAESGLEEALARATAVAAGPGIGVGEAARSFLDALLERWPGALVLDADALTLLAGRLEALAGRQGVPVLTPHPAELARLLGRETNEVVSDRLGAAREAARRSGAVVLAKGARTVIVAPDGRALVNPTGTPGLASGGAGDVLTGVVGSLLAQGVPAWEAAAAAAWLHGRAAELAAERFAGAVPAGELVGYLAAAEREARALA